MFTFKNLIVSIGVTLIATLFLSTVAFAAETDDNSTSYYDIVNTSEWAEMNRLERISACQLSKEELQSLSTDELLHVALDYPFFIDALAFNTKREGILRVLGENTALQELLNREDGGEVLISRYVAINAATPISIVNDNNDFSDLWKLQIMLAQPEFVDSMNEQQIAKILEIAEEKYEEKSTNSEYEGITGLFYESVNENSGVTTYAYDTYVTTPNGSNVLVTVWQSSDGDFSSDVKESLALEVAEAYPNATLLRDATIKYNCHSYAWYSTSSSNTYWMKYPGAFITDGSYPELTKLNTSVGSRIVYYETFDESYDTPTRSAIIYSYKDFPKSKRTFVVESKWGNLGLYQHDSSDCPYTGPLPYDIKYFS